MISSVVADGRFGPVVAIVAAAGASARMNGREKLTALLGDRPVIAHSLETLDACDRIAAVQLVASQANIQDLAAIARRAVLHKPLGTCLGGPSRGHSVLCGLRAAASGGYEWALVHDGARPFVTTEMIERGLDAAAASGAAIAAVAATDTVKICDPAGRVISSPPRGRVWLAQTPQIARFAALLQALEALEHRLSEFTDEASVLEAYGLPAVVFEGSQGNIKIATSEDLLQARLLLDLMSQLRPI